MSALAEAVGVITDEAEAVRALATDHECSVDLETGGLDPYFSDIAVVSLYGQQSGAKAVIHIRGRAFGPLKELFARRDVRWTLHNGPNFDLQFLGVHEGIDPLDLRVYDTLTGEAVVLPSGRRNVSLSLANTAKRRLGVTIKKDIDHGSWMKPGDMSQEQLDYCLGDVIWMHDLRNEQYAKADAADSGKSKSRVRAALDTEMRLASVMARVVLNGMPIDIARLRAYIGTEQEKINDLAPGLQHLLGAANLNSPQQVLRGLRALGYEGASTDEQALGKARTEPGDVGRAVLGILEYRHAAQRVKMYTDGWIAKYVRDGRVHCNYWQVSTDSGRMSSSQPNMQQIPREHMRKVFRAPEGFALIKADYGQVELRVGAWLAQDEAMMRILDLEDTHMEFAKLIFGKPADAISGEERYFAKRVNFRLLFGGGPRGLYDDVRAEGSALTLRDCYALTDTYYARFPGVYTMILRAKSRVDWAKANGAPIVLVLPTGMRRILVAEDRIHTRILNTTIQGTAAVGMKLGLLEAARRGLAKYIVAVVHDELTSCVPLSEAQDFAAEMEESMIVGMKEVIGGNIVVAAHLGPSWDGSEEFETA